MKAGRSPAGARTPQSTTRPTPWRVNNRAPTRRSARTSAWHGSQQGLCRSGKSVRMGCVRAGAAVGVIDADRLLRSGLRSAGPVPGDGLLDRVVVRGGFQVAEGGFEFAGVDDKRRAELVSRLAHLPEQGREDARSREQCWAGDGGVDR